MRAPLLIALALYSRCLPVCEVAFGPDVLVIYDAEAHLCACWAPSGPPVQAPAPVRRHNFRPFG
jgi:hypothetical protein